VVHPARVALGWGIDNPVMLPEIPQKMLDGLIDRGTRLQSDGFISMWADAASLQRHVKRRVNKGEIVDADDYQQKTLAVFAQADRIVTVIPTNKMMHSTGKVAMMNGEWVVLLSENGGIVTSYPFIPEILSFEGRHKRDGDMVNEYKISNDIRTRLANLFR